MISGIIDIGTNTFNLLIENEKKHVFYNDKIPVKIGKGGIDKNIIAADAFARGIDALKRFKAICTEYQVDQIFAFATSAVRSASNGKEFVAEAEKQAAIKINVIDGDKEALLIYEGVKNAVELGSKPAAIIDIGGGSTEIIIASSKGVLWERSYPLGVSRLLETFKPNDPITVEEINTLENYFSEILTEFFLQVEKHKPSTMIGSSGSFETIHDVCAMRFNAELLQPEQTSALIHLFEFGEVCKQLVSSTTTERVVIPGMLSMRADTIHLAALQIDFILKKAGIKKVLISTYALKEGVLFSLEKEHEPWLIS